MINVLKICLTFFIKYHVDIVFFKYALPSFLVQNFLPAVTLTTGIIHFSVYHEEGRYIIL